MMARPIHTLAVARRAEVRNTVRITDRHGSARRFTLTVGLLAAAWSVIPLRHPRIVAGWLHNEMLPYAGLWVVGLSLAILVMRRSLLTGSTKLRPVWLSIGGALLCLLWGWRLSPHLSHYAHLAASAACMAAIGGRAWLRVTAPALVALGCLPGLPPGAHELVLGSLQALGEFVTLAYCRGFLDAGYTQAGGGIVLAEPGVGWVVSLRIGPACSGYRSLFGLMLLSLLCCSHPRLSLRQSLLIVGIGPLLAVSVNVLRLLTTASLHHYGLRALASGVAHSALGQALLVVEGGVLCLIFLRQLKRHPPATRSGT